MMTNDDAREYSESLGQIGEGWWRQIAWAHRQGIPALLGMSTREWAEKYHGYLRMPIDDRRNAISELAEEGMSTREIGDILGINHSTVVRSSGSGEATGANAPEPYNSPEYESEATGANATDDPEPEAPNATGAHVAHNSGDFEWYTPREYIEAAAAVMGGIDLDPASNALANQIVGATRFYSEEDDGLAHPWRGRVWLNPPYAYPLIEQFCTRLIQSLAGGEVAEAIVLANNATETAWFQTLASAASAFCFPRGRIKFWHPGKGLATPLQGQTIIYSGNRVAEFRNEFSKFGVVSHL